MPESNPLRIEEIKSRLSTIEQEKSQLLQELKALSKISVPSGSYGTLACDNPLTTSDERIALFTRLFRCRENVFPKLWENKQKGTKGYSPVCQEEWVPGICKKPNIKCSQCSNRKFVPLNESIIRSHLEGKITIGTYTLREDDSCIFLAADFDKKEWQYDAMAYRESAKNLGIEVSIERSRSGNGAHAWIFFSQPVAARIARQMGTIILTQAIIDTRPAYKRIKIKFTGTLLPAQKKALQSLLKNESGVLLAPPGAGKTVIACALIAKRKLPTLILVHRKQLADQWKLRLLEFSDLQKKQIGIYDLKGIKRKGIVDIGMFQTLAHVNTTDAIINDYGLIIIDECHRVPAPSFEPVIRRIAARHYICPVREI